MAESKLTSEEIEKFRSLLEHIEQIKRDYKGKAARELVAKAAKTLLVGIASTIVAMALIWDKLVSFVQWVLR